jgi:hypothetical protein
LGTINVNGYGGIINTAVSAADFQAINVNGGFGIISSTFGSTGTFNSSGLIQTDGLGIRNTAIDAGTSINSVTARGEGQRLDVRDYDPRVRFSERGRFDPESGRWLDGSNDLHRAIGTNRRSSRVSGLTNSGIIENTRILGEGDLVNGVRAFAIRAVPRAGAIPGTAELPPTSSRYPMTISFANSSGTIDVLNNVDGLQMVTGRIRNFRTGGNVEDLNASVSGLIANIDIGGILRRTATFDARGPQGQIRDVRVARSLLGRVTSTLDIDGVDVGSLGGTVASVGRINNLTVRGDVLSGGYARGAKGIGVLRVGGDVLEGGVISARSYGTTRIGGTVFGDVIVD